MTRLCLAIVFVPALLILSASQQPAATCAAPAVSLRPAFNVSTAEVANAPVVAAEGQSLSHRLRSELADGQLDQFTFMQAALIAGGVESTAEYSAYTQRFATHCQILRQQLAGRPVRHERCDTVLSWLHAKVLTGNYRADCSSIAHTLATGEYNCLTATILFQAVAAESGLDTCAVTSGSHVINVVHGEPALYIETTRPDWRATSLIDAPPATQEVVRRGRELNGVQLLGKVYYNLGVARIEAGDFSQAAQLLQIAGDLDPQDDLARQNLLATWNNWALAECDRGRYRQAVELVLQGLAVDGDYPLLQLNDLHIHQRWIRSLCDAGEFGSAVEVLEKAGQRRPETDWFSHTKSAVLDWKNRQPTPTERTAVD